DVLTCWEENLGPALGSHSFPYVEEPSDEELSDYRSYRNLGGTPQTASPVKITLTESQPPAAKTEPQQQPPPVSVSERENVLSVGLQGVPTVTLSEPEDDSPASTPNASPTRRHTKALLASLTTPLTIPQSPRVVLAWLATTLHPQPTAF
uniref:Uncharacterized protein n=1 Tax=Seriola dumerili TaxID=41447 RepID=A0A3B4T304_SERDU